MESDSRATAGECGVLNVRSFTAETTREPQYQVQLDVAGARGFVPMGPTASHIFRTDPRRLGILLARYKFCAKMLSGKTHVLEAGCGDSFGTNVVLQEVDAVHGVDFDPTFVQWSNTIAEQEGLNATYEVVDLTSSRPTGWFDGAFSLDVIEHIEPEDERRFMENVCAAMHKEAVVIIGTPNVTAHAYASEWSRRGHINLHSHETLRALMSDYFSNVFVFSMNDEVVHTGFSPMAHYLFAMGVGLRG
jgi:2-polyprenyl-3-methyl-5-hydroxy-6-metoxy-1,4-benzoquinol methylase